MNVTEREREVLQLISEGFSNAAIGRRIYLSEDSVKGECRKLFHTLGARDRAHAVRKGFEHGLLSMPSGQPVAVDWVAAEMARKQSPPRSTGDRHIGACFAARSCPCREGSTWRFPVAVSS